jgi:putative chitinase
MRPEGYVADPDNPGWWYDPKGDASKPSSWWQEPPKGFIPDPKNPGWYFNPAGDPNNKATWWHDATVKDEDAGAFAVWSAAQIAGVTECPKASIVLYWPLVFSALQSRNQASVRSCAGAIGTIAIETASRFASVEEAFWLSPEARLAYFNDTSQHAVYSGGPQYHGRCLVQLTHDYNYRAAGDAIGVNLVANPDAAMEPANAAKIFAWYWASRDIQSMADQENWTAVRRAVQGGTDGLPRLIQVATDLMKLAR